MKIESGTKLGRYEIRSKVGMGAVYRARDTKLNRDIAIKILPEAFAQDVERLANRKTIGPPDTGAERPLNVRVTNIRDCECVALGR